MISNETKIAWLGAGTMGAPMAANLAKAGVSSDALESLGGQPVA